MERATYQSVNFSQEQQCLGGDIPRGKDRVTVRKAPDHTDYFELACLLAIHLTSVNK